VGLDAADAESPLKESELQVLRSQYLKEQEAQHITVQTKFNYAWGLIKSDVHPNQLEGVKLLTGTKPLVRRHVCFVVGETNGSKRSTRRLPDDEGNVFITSL
jgi:hypothetical protein